MHFKSVPLMLHRGLLQDDEKISALMSSPYAVPYLLSSEMLNTDVLYRSHIHGQGHIERVMLLGAMIAMNEKLNIKDTRLLLFACSYHDIGRRDDTKDDYHGLRSAELITKYNLTDIPGDLGRDETAMLKAAIATHSMHDDTLDRNAERFRVPPCELEHCRQLCFCLKDADNLDRVRLHDLDTKHLRHTESIKMADTAEYIFRRYQEYR